MVKHRKSVIRTKDVGTKRTGEIPSVSKELVPINCERQKPRRRLLDKGGQTYDCRDSGKGEPGPVELLSIHTEDGSNERWGKLKSRLVICSRIGMEPGGGN